MCHFVSQSQKWKFTTKSMTADLTEFGRFHEFSCFDLGGGK